MTQHQVKTYKNAAGRYAQIANDFKDSTKDFEALRQYVATMGPNAACPEYAGWVYYNLGLDEAPYEVDPSTFQV